MSRVVHILLAAIVLLVTISTSAAQQPPAIAAPYLAEFPPLHDVSGQGDFELIVAPLAQWDCGSAANTARDLLTQNNVRVIVLTLCGAEIVSMLAPEFTDKLFITPVLASGQQLPNTLQLSFPGEGVLSASRQAFGANIGVSVCGSRWEASGTGLFACMRLPGDGSTEDLTVEQLHYQAALDALRSINFAQNSQSPSQVRNDLNGRTVDTALGRLTFDDQGRALSDLPVELTWRVEDNANASDGLRNASPETILEFLRSNVGPASASVSKVCGTTCPSQCNNSCQTEGSQQCCSVASEDPQPN